MAFFEKETVISTIMKCRYKAEQSMQLDTGEGALAGKAQELQTQCPIEHGTWSKQKTARLAEPVDSPIECDAEGVWHVRGFAQARAILRSKHTQQAGFNADMIGNVPGMRNQPILYQEGKTHDLQRKQTARFFTPKTVSTKYRQMMEQLSDQLIADLQRKKRLDLSHSP